LILENLDQGRATVEEIAEDLNMSDVSVTNKLSELVEDGRVVRLTCFDLPGDEA
jgi:DNA-binding HxlR family transcriptional regulator